MKEFKKTDPEFYQIITDFVYDEACKGNLLDKTERYMCILAGLMGVQGKAMFKVTVEKALEANVDPVIIKEVIYQATAYLGIGRTYDYLMAANEVFKEKIEKCNSSCLCVSNGIYGIKYTNICCIYEKMLSDSQCQYNRI